MSEIMLAVLRLPDNLFWKECPVARAQHNSIRKEAADRIAELEAENARLRDALKEVADGEIYPQQVARAALYA